MTSKQRAELRAKANSLNAVFQIGKGGVSEALLTQTEDALKARELIKLKVLLETSPKKPREIADSLAGATGAQVVQVVGGSIILFKENPELHKPPKKKKPAAKPFKKKRMSTNTKPRIRRGNKTAGEGQENSPRTSSTSRAVNAYGRQGDKKTSHKPLRKGGPRSTGRFKAPTKKYQTDSDTPG